MGSLVDANPEDIARPATWSQYPLTRLFVVRYWIGYTCCDIYISCETRIVCRVSDSMSDNTKTWNVEGDAELGIPQNIRFAWFHQHEDDISVSPYNHILFHTLKTTFPINVSCLAYTIWPCSYYKSKAFVPTLYIKHPLSVFFDHIF